MSYINKHYMTGLAAAFNDLGICKIANMDGVVNRVLLDLTTQMVKVAQGEGGMATPMEQQQVAQSGLTEGDIQSAAKLVKIVADMKQQTDMATAAAAGTPVQTAAGMSPSPGQAQPPMPPPPQPPGPPAMAGAGAPPMGAPQTPTG